jgi:hypothetical protein
MKVRDRGKQTGSNRAMCGGVALFVVFLSILRTQNLIHLHQIFIFRRAPIDDLDISRFTLSPGILTKDNK